MTTLDKIATKIIKEQELLIGPVAWDEAGKVKGLHIVDKKTGDIVLEGDSKFIVDSLINQYGSLFGRAAREVCREAAATLVADLPPADVPNSLK